MSKKLLADPAVQKLIESVTAKATKAERARAVAAVAKHKTAHNKVSDFAKALTAELRNPAPTASNGNSD